MILGVGIDLCETSRMEDALTDGRFLERFFTGEERAYILSRGKGAAESMAGHYAAKEAALKAMGCGIVLPLRDVSVAHDPHGAPYYVFSGKARDRMRETGSARMHLSITHSAGFAAAVAVLEGSSE